MKYSKKTNLASICQIQSGYTARNRLEPVVEGGVPAIQLRDLNGEEDYDPAGAVLYPLAPSFERYWAGPGDVLFRSRGERNTAVVIAPDSNAAAIAILPLIVLRPNKNLVDSRYLAWAINHSITQRYLDKCALGTNIRMIPKAALDELEVELPDLETQRLITSIDTLARREHQLAHELADRNFELTGLALLKQTQRAHRNTIATKGEPS
jgi:hypothetical protein